MAGGGGRQTMLTTDVIIQDDSGRIVLIRRKNPPHGWALPGGFLDYGETLEACAVREAKEETSLDVELVRQLHAYSDPSRDPRGHSVTVVFLGRAGGEPKGTDDAAEARWFDPDRLPSPLVFDHAAILADFLSGRLGPRAVGSPG